MEDLYWRSSGKHIWDFWPALGFGINRKSGKQVAVKDSHSVFKVKFNWLLKKSQIYYGLLGTILSTA